MKMKPPIINYSAKLKSTIENCLEGVDPQEFADGNNLGCIRRYVEQDGWIQFINFENINQLNNFVTLAREYFSDTRNGLDWNTIQEDINKENLTYKIERRKIK